MLAIRRILLPVDFSAQAYAVAPFAHAMASRFYARVILLSVVPRPSPSWMQQAGDPELTDADQLKNDLEPRLDDAFRKEFAGLEVERAVQIGDPAEVIASFAHTQGVDMIMIPTHGYRPLRRMLIGSVAAKVLHDAQCPVWTRVPGTDRQSAPAPARPTVVCAIDRKPESTPVLQWAAEFSERDGAVLKLVHIIPDLDEWTPNLSELTAWRNEVRRDIDRLLQHAGLTAPFTVLIGKIGSGLCEYAKNTNADFVVIGRGRIQDMSGRLGKNAYDIIRHAPCSVISI